MRSGLTNPLRRREGFPAAFQPFGPPTEHKITCMRSDAGRQLAILLFVVALEAVLVMTVGVLLTLLSIPLQVVGGAILLLAIKVARGR